jgi:hypothetical protein
MSDVFVDATDDAVDDDSMTIEMTEARDSVPELGTSHDQGHGARRGFRDGLAPPTTPPSHFPSSVRVGVRGRDSPATSLGSLGRVESHRFADVAPDEAFTDLEREKIDDDLLGDLGLADFMLLAYTVSNIYQRHKARSRKAKLDDSEVTGHDETLLFIVVALYAASVLTMSLTLMGGGIVCRPLNVSLSDFALGSGAQSIGLNGGLFEYGADFINRVCETQIKLETSQFWPVFTMVTFVMLFIGAWVNAKFINEYNRRHAIARRQYHSPLIGKEPVRAHEREPGSFEKFYLNFMAAKVLSILVVVGMLSTFWYTVLSFATVQQSGTPPDVAYSGGNLLSRSGAICDGNSLRYEEAFDARYRCHLKGEAQMHYLKYLVLFSASLVIVVSAYQTLMMRSIHRGYARWKRRREELEARVERDQALPDELTPEMTSMFKMTRGVARLMMYYLKPSPPEGDLPGLIAKAIFGLRPATGELANISSRMLTEFASPAEISDMLMSFMKGALGEHIGESEDVRKIVLATVTAWKDSSTQRYLKGIVDTVDAIHKDDGEDRGGSGAARRPSEPRASGGGGNADAPNARGALRTARPEPRVDAIVRSESMRRRMHE